MHSTGGYQVFSCALQSIFDLKDEMSIGVPLMSVGLLVILYYLWYSQYAASIDL